MCFEKSGVLEFCVVVGWSMDGRWRMDFVLLMFVCDVF
jgi:hypothetical protein